MNVGAGRNDAAGTHSKCSIATSSPITGCGERRAGTASGKRPRGTAAKDAVDEQQRVEVCEKMRAVHLFARVSPTGNRPRGTVRTTSGSNLQYSMTTYAGG